MRLTYAHAPSSRFFRLQEVTTIEYQMSPTEPSDTEGFTHYQSLLSQYPSLHVHSHLSGSHQRRSASTNHLEVFLGQFDLKHLKAVAIHKWLETNTSKCLCPYEVPGGGECRDRDCQAVHPSKLAAIEPSGTHPYHSSMVAYHLIFSPLLLLYIHATTSPPFLRLQMMIYLNTSTLWCPHAQTSHLKISRMLWKSLVVNTQDSLSRNGSRMLWLRSVYVDRFYVGLALQNRPSTCGSRAFHMLSPRRGRQATSRGD